MRAVLIALLLGLTADVTAAQNAPFRPLDVGNMWVYAFEGTGPSLSGSCSARPVTGTATLRVVRDTTVEGSEARILQCTERDASGIETKAYREAVTLGFAPFLYTGSSIVNRCDLLDAPVPTSMGGVENPVVISGIPYVMNAVAVAARPPQRSEGGDKTGYRYEFGDRVGVTYAEIDHEFVFLGGCHLSRYRLEYASVGGEEFGVRPVSGETDALPAQARTLRAFPSPASSVVSIESTERASVEVVDALGRRVATGEAAPGRVLRLDVSVWPTGVYVARSTEAGTVRFVVVR